VLLLVWIGELGRFGIHDRWTSWYGFSCYRSIFTSRAWMKTSSLLLGQKNHVKEHIFRYSYVTACCSKQKCRSLLGTKDAWFVHESMRTEPKVWAIHMTPYGMVAWCSYLYEHWPDALPSHLYSLISYKQLRCNLLLVHENIPVQECWRNIWCISLRCYVVMRYWKKPNRKTWFSTSGETPKVQQRMELVWLSVS
jgi:hypothetical protein